MGRIKFIHITKTGGTSIEEIGKLNGFSWGRYDKKLKNIKKKFKISPYWHIPISFFEENPYNKNNILFTVVRNPYTRIISEAFCKFGGKYHLGPFLNKFDFNRYIID